MSEIRRWRARKSIEGYTYKVPVGALVKIIKAYPKRRVLIEYNGELVLTYQGCLEKLNS